MYVPNIVALVSEKDQWVARMPPGLKPDRKVLGKESGLIQEYKRQKGAAADIERNKVLLLMKARWQELCQQYDCSHWKDVIVYGTVYGGSEMVVFVGTWDEDQSCFGYVELDKIDCSTFDGGLRAYRMVRRIAQLLAKEHQWTRCNKSSPLLALLQNPTVPRDSLKAPPPPHGTGTGTPSSPTTRDSKPPTGSNDTDHRSTHTMRTRSASNDFGRRAGQRPAPSGASEAVSQYLGLSLSALKKETGSDSHGVYYSKSLGVYIKVNVHSNREAKITQRLLKANVPHMVQPVTLQQWDSGFVMVTREYDILPILEPINNLYYHTLCLLQVCWCYYCAVVYMLHMLTCVA